ncbi:MAG: TIGR03016 family PEP-CTERM system-associated outer membrane protein [Massilia sp.]
MTITTAKRPRVIDRLSRLPRLAPLAAAALLLSNPCYADWKFTPTLGLTETYTDNVNLQRDELARSAWVTDLAPGFSAFANSRRLKLMAGAQYHQFVYGGQQAQNTNDSQYQYRLDAKSMLVDELLYLDAAASGGPQAVSAFGPQVNSNLYAMGNRTNVRTWRISPYLRHHFGRSADMALRYTRDAVDAGQRNPFGSSNGDSVALDLASGESWRDLGWGLNLSRQDVDNRLAGQTTAETAVGNLRYRLSRTWSATASAGYDKYDYQALGGRTAGRNWSAGFIWTPSSRTTVQASYGRHFFGKTGSLAASLRTRRTAWSINYSDIITTTRQQFLLPAAIDTASMLDRLFSSSIPDPAARAQAVAAYMQATGLPPALANNVNYLSNRFMREKGLRAAAIVRGAHGDLVLSAYQVDRTALSLQQSDSQLLGSQLATLNDNTSQRGLEATWNYRLNARSSAQLAAIATRTRSLSTGVVNTNQVLRAGLVRQLSGKLAAAVEVRHVIGDLGAGASRYRENAVSATLSKQF